jgi:ABC-type branched-subunit amino acid transport system permease subunit
MAESSPLPSSRWPRTIIDNGLVLLVVAAMVPLGWFVEDTRYVDSYYIDVIQKIGLAITLAVSLQLINGISGQFSLGHAGFMAVGAYLGGYATLAFTGTTNANHDTVYFQKPFAAAGFFACLLMCGVICAAALYAVFWMIRMARKAHHSIPPLLLLVVAAWFLVDFSKAYGRDPMPAYFVWSKATSLVGDLFSWSIGLTERVAPKLDGLLPSWTVAQASLLVALVGGGACAGAVGFVVGLPTLRLRGDYLAIATLGFAAIIGVVIYNTPALGGALGLQGRTYSETVEQDVRTPDGESVTVDVPVRAITPWIFGAAVVTTVVVVRLARSPKGRAIVAVREDEIAAAATGIDVTHHKVLAFVIGAFFAGVAGSLFAHQQGFITTGQFELMKSVELVVIVTIGGLGSVTGAIVAAVVLTWLPEFLRDPASWIALVARPWGVTSARDLNLPQWLVISLAKVGEFRLVIYALLLIVVMIARSNMPAIKGWWQHVRRRRTSGPAAPPVTT